MAPKAADCKNVHNPNLQCKNDFLPYFDGFFLSLLKVYDHKIIFSWPLCIFGSKITKKNVSLIFYPKIPNPPPLRPLCLGRLRLGMAMRIYLPMRIDADIRIIRHMSDIARYMRRIFRIGILSASAWPSLISTISTPPCHTSLESY